MPPKTKIFVGKLPPSCEEHDLQKLFERYGEVTECSILGNFAFVHMKSEDQAATAIRALNNWNLNGTNISVEQSTGEKRDGMGRGRGGFRGRGGGPMRGGRGMRPSPYDRPMGGDRYGMHPMPVSSMRNGYYDDFDRREMGRRPLSPAMDRRPLPPPMGREMFHDPYDRYDSYERMPPMMRRSPPLVERHPPPTAYDRREDPYADIYRRERPPYPGREMFAARRSPPHASPPRRYPGPPRDMPPRRF